MISQLGSQLSKENNDEPGYCQQALNSETLEQGVAFLCTVDAQLEWIQRNLGSPPLWAREPGFPTLVLIILEQQVSLASARAAYKRLQDATQRITPQTFLLLNDDELLQIGFSRQKMGYCRGLANSIMEGEFDLRQLDILDDATARATLMKVRGIGPWTADIYLLMALLRPDTWPAGDLALATAVQVVKRLPTKPGAEEMDRIAAPWRPWRAVAARLLWHYYLSLSDRKKEDNLQI